METKNELIMKAEASLGMGSWRRALHYLSKIEKLEPTPKEL